MPSSIRLVLAWAINGAALWVANALFSGVRIHGWWAYIIGAAVLGIANTVIKPVLALISLSSKLIHLQASRNEQRLEDGGSNRVFGEPRL